MFRSLFSLALALILVSCSNSPFGFAPEEGADSTPQYSLLGAGVSNLEALLGSAYNSEKETFPGDRCLTSKKKPSLTGKPQSGFTFQESISEEQISDDLGFGLGARARFGAVSTSLSANFLSSTVSNSLSVSAVWESTYEFPVQKLDQPVLSPIGRQVKDNFERWNETCGNEYVAELSTGAKLFFSVRVDFSSEQDKKEFEAKFAVSGPLWGVEGELKKASEKMGRNIKVTVTAHQIGGDTSKITGIFDQTENGKTNFLQCKLGSLENCAKVIQAALSYATDTEHGFPSQLNPKSAAVLSYKTAPYSAVAIYPGAFPGLAEATKLGRKEVADSFEVQFRHLVLAKRLLKQKNLGTRKEAIEAQEGIVKKNVSMLLDISKVCYENAPKCWPTVEEKLHLASVDTSVFIPLTFQQLCKQAQANEAAESLVDTLDTIQKAIKDESRQCEVIDRTLHKLTALTLEKHREAPVNIDLRMLATQTQLLYLTATGLGLDDLSALGGSHQSAPAKTVEKPNLRCGAPL